MKAATIEERISRSLQIDEHPGILPHTIPVIEDWEIHRLSQDKDAFIERLVDSTYKRIVQLKGTDLEEELAKLVYLENIRLTKESWKVDTKDEKEFWKRAKKVLLKRSVNKMAPESAKEQDTQIFKDIIERYAREIIGNFEPKTYRFASKALPFGFNRLLNPANLNLKRLVRGEPFKLTDRIKTYGYIDELRNLSKLGTIVLVPTHHSNLDSILIGWCLHTLGVPAFQYGAGLNLYNNPIMKFFFSRLGAYKIDRRKKNTFYLETLKAYSRLSTQRGVPSIFFPGGTRSRSGQLETRLKLGLLGTAMDAQRMNFQLETQDKPAKKIFVVPMVVNYHFVLEAATLIKQQLQKQGQEKYFVDKVALPGITKLLKFVWKFFSAKSEVLISIGKPMDLFGNDVNVDGNSLDKDGEIVNIRDYFVSNGEITADFQRDSEYTKMLGEVIVERFFRENIVLSSHLMAYSAFSILNKKHRRLDLYGLLRLPKEDRVIPRDQFVRVVESLQQRLLEMEKANKVRLSAVMYGDVNALIEDGLKNMGVYHPQKALKENKEKDLVSEDMNLLYFYHNRLKGYGLEQFV